MMARVLSLRFSDIIEAIANIRGVIEDLPYRDVRAALGKRWLVERGIEIISEASRHIPHDVKAAHPAIPWAKVAEIGNVLRHAYDRIAPDILGKLARDDLPTLDAGCRSELAIAVAREKRR